jgi:hypothetical protein
MSAAFRQLMTGNTGFSVPAVSADMKNTYSYIQKENTIKSIFDRKSNEKYLRTVDEALGDARISVRMYDSAGHVITTPYFSSETNDVVVPDSTGAVPFINGDLVEAKIHEAQLIDERVDALMHKCIVSDELCQMVLNLNLANYNKLLGPGANSAGATDEMKALDGRVGYISALPASSALQIQALSKLRYVVRNRLHEYKPIHSGKSKADATTARHVIAPAAALLPTLQSNLATGATGIPAP